MAANGTAARVLVTLRVDSPCVKVTLNTPPDASVPSAQWMSMLAAVMRPHEGHDNLLSCILVGTMQEVCSHLWEHHILWMHLRLADGAGGTDRHVAVHLAELLDPSTLTFSNVIEREVALEEVCHDDSGMLAVGLRLEALGLEETQPPTLPDFFAFVLESFSSGDADQTNLPTVRIKVRCASVERCIPLTRGHMQHNLVLVESWARVPDALSDLALSVQKQVDECTTVFPEISLNMDQLCDTVRNGSGNCRAAEIHAGGIAFRMMVNHFRWAAASPTGTVEIREICGFPRSCWTSGMRIWRVSIEIRSVRLTTRAASIFFTYSYNFFRQPRPFRTNPPTVARKNVLVHLPHGFAAYTLGTSEDTIQARFQEPLRLEAWHRDKYKKDEPLGVADVDLAPVLAQPLQHASCANPDVHAFRVLDQICPLACSVEGHKIGVVRLVASLEDLGSVPNSKASEVCHGKPQIDGLLPSGIASKPARIPTAVSDAAAFELEVWRRVEEEKFRSHLAKLDAELCERLEDEYAKRELERVAEFRTAQSELRSVEAKLKQRIQELQQRASETAAGERQAQALQQGSQVGLDTELQEADGVARLRVARAAHDLELARSKHKRLDERLKELDNDLSATHRKSSDLRAEINACKSEECASCLLQLRETLQATHLELNEQRSRTEAITASRDHFKKRVEGLCEHLSNFELDALPPNGTVNSQFSPILRTLPVNDTQPPNYLPMNPSAQTNSDAEVAQSLRRIQEDLATLAKEWGSAAAASQPKSIENPAITYSGKPRFLPAACGPQSGTRARHLVAPCSQHFGPVWPISVQETPPTTAACASMHADSCRHLEWLTSTRSELLQSGMYDVHDAVLLALDAKIAEANRMVRGGE